MSNDVLFQYNEQSAICILQICLHDLKSKSSYKVQGQGVRRQSLLMGPYALRSIDLDEIKVLEPCCDSQALLANFRHFGDEQLGHAEPR